ncbi:MULTISPECIES: cobalamin-independent methionine synthase II family protein [unclassified Schaalia]|uniref:cobalamin-independent methionine synthase II family protein n=1 Tax=unclassified Schaalia TaxID=2691889 RepID=UPI001E2E9DF4|nr:MULTISPECIES: cobalamin-independent methionine synthase II family protein [unclassified Schaalia]MCD4549272.1 cobalamin-independent methionine synthase II family protein [Schaalia sp. lx-260]MCD4557081.1 cobalamin-independent methionine synthase II family protein [Schaalia sp. lx-100]
MPVLTTHVGSLPRSARLLEANKKYEEGTLGREEFSTLLREETDAVIARQSDIGLSIVNDGEYGHAMTLAVDYGAWWSYSFTRFSGLEIVQEPPAPRPSRSGRLVLDHMTDRRDWVAFDDAYHDPTSGIHLATASIPVWPVVTGELKYIGHEIVQRDVDALLHALHAAGREARDGFVAAISPASAARIGNVYYEDDEAAVWAWAEALREEYLAITQAGLTLQIDAPDLAESWDQFVVEPSIEDYRAFSKVRIEALNYALRDIDPSLVRYHVCWGSWHGPHSTDLDFAAIVDLALEVNANGLTFEAANARHAHEWEIWKDTVLPDGKYLIPGVVSHSTNVVEHPRLVAQRIRQFADLVGDERVIASTDCGLGGRIHPQIAWAKLEALTEGARLA